LDKLTFISKVIESIAWPAVALILGLVFRKRLLELLPTMKKFKAGPVEAEFELATKQVLVDASKEVASATPPAIAEELQADDTTKNIVFELLTARTDPAGMILEGWSKIDGQLHQLGRQINLIDDPLESTGKVYSKIKLADVLPPATFKLIDELRELRNKVAHVKVIPTVDAAQDYLVAVARVVDLIKNYRKKLPNYKGGAQ
jgi:sulfite reductase alpha subunit-like flavoprotein